MRSQIKLNFLIGYLFPKDADDADDADAQMEFEYAVISKATELCGGCAVIDTIGYWREDGARPKERFTGEQSSEHTLNISLTCEIHKQEQVYEEMKQAITEYALRYSMETDWVHVEAIHFTGRHFSVQQQAERMDAAVYRDLVSPGTRGAR